MAAPLSHPMTCPLCHTAHQVGAADSPRVGAARVRMGTVATCMRFAAEHS